MYGTVTWLQVIRAQTLMRVENVYHMKQRHGMAFRNVRHTVLQSLRDCSI